MHSLFTIKGTLTNSVDLDQTPQNAASDKGIHCLALIQKVLEHMNRYVKNMRTSMVRN